MTQTEDAGKLADENSPNDIRALGWTVAVHNDYRIGGKAHTFWLFVRGGHAIKGEGPTDADALNEIRAALRTPTGNASLNEEGREAAKYPYDNPRDPYASPERLPSAGGEREALDELVMIWKGRARALTILRNTRGTPDDLTLGQIEAFEECSKELRAALSPHSGKSDGEN